MSSVMTANEMLPAIGTKVLLRMEKLLIEAHVCDVRFVWGNPQLEVEPVAGSGKQWVMLDRIASLPETTLVPRKELRR